MGRLTAFLDTLPPSFARAVRDAGSGAMARLERAAARGPEALAEEARALGIGRRSGTYYVDPSGTASAVRPGAFGEASAPRFDGVEATTPRQPDFALGSDDWMAMSRSADANAPGRLRQRSNPIPGGRRGDPNPAGDLKRIAAQNIDDARAAREAASRPSPAGRAAKGAAAAGAAAGVGVMLAPKDMGLTEAGNPADLKDEPVVPDFIDATMMGADESDMLRPMGQKPAVAPKPEPVDYSLEARKIIDQLNAMRRKAGGEVPQAQQMMQEANRLIAMGNKQRNTPGYQIPKADPARDPYQQARNLIDQVNNMYRQGFSQDDPRIQKIMARVRELQAEGDAIRNKGVYR